MLADSKDMFRSCYSAESETTPVNLARARGESGIPKCWVVILMNDREDKEIQKEGFLLLQQDFVFLQQDYRLG